MMKRVKGIGRLSSVALLALAGGWVAPPAAEAAGERPNVLMIFIDDHAANMTSVLDASRVKTPNMERLAARGTWFTRAYNAAPSCGPSRTALLTGVHPVNSGVYYNSQAFRRTKTPIAQAQTLQQLFLSEGYLTAGYGKVEHTGYQNDELKNYTPGYRVRHRDPRQVTHPEQELWKQVIPGTLRVPDPEYLPTRFGMLPDEWDADDPARLTEDTETANRTLAFLGERHEQPFFLTCGFYRPHSERIVPKRYYDLYPLDEMRIPPSYLPGDLDDVPVAGRWRATKLGTHAAVVKAGLWREYMRSYYAATSYVDEQIGRVLDALEASPYSGNTIVVFASDNGYNAGEKDMWAKFALWDQTCRVVFAISLPGSRAQVVDTPVSLIDIYPTLLKLCRLPPPTAQTLDGVDLGPLLQGESSLPRKTVLSTWGVGNHSVTDGRFRYIRYLNGDEELYDLSTDRYEWTNQAGNPRFQLIKQALAAQLPAEDAPEIEPARPWDGSELRADLFEAWAGTTSSAHP